MKTDTTEAMIEMIKNPGKELFVDGSGWRWRYWHGSFEARPPEMTSWQDAFPDNCTFTRIEQEKSNDEVARHIMSQEGGPKTFMSLLLDEVDRRIAKAVEGK